MLDADRPFERPSPEYVQQIAAAAQAPPPTISANTAAGPTAEDYFRSNQLLDFFAGVQVCA